MRRGVAPRSCVARRLLRGLARLTVSSVAALLLVLGLASWAALPAHAAAEDQIDEFSVDYTLRPSGVLDVRETIVWRFGDDSGRHGIQRDLVTREQYSDTEDAVYGISGIAITSPDRVATQHTSSTTERDGGRTEVLNLKIGDPDRTISRDTATYVLSYRVTGAMRTFADYDELFWDATGTGNPRIGQAAVTVEVPGGAQDTSCFYGPPRSTAECPTNRTTPDGGAEFGVTDLAQGDNLSFGVKVTPGLVTDNAPHLEPDGSKLTAGERATVLGVGVLGVGSLVGAPLVATSATRVWRPAPRRWPGRPRGSRPTTPTSRSPWRSPRRASRSRRPGC
jgi:hypothetical protein